MEDGSLHAPPPPPPRQSAVCRVLRENADPADPNRLSRDAVLRALRTLNVGLTEQQEERVLYRLDPENKGGGDSNLIIVRCPKCNHV